jgi:hypothetical protein
MIKESLHLINHFFQVFLSDRLEEGLGALAPANLKAGLALHFAYYNFCRVHSKIRVSPAIEAGITDPLGTLAELVTA